MFKNYDQVGKTKKRQTQNCPWDCHPNGATLQGSSATRSLQKDNKIIKIPNQSLSSQVSYKEPKSDPRSMHKVNNTIGVGCTRGYLGAIDSGPALKKSQVDRASSRKRES